jgi:hypothetical protein
MGCLPCGLFGVVGWVSGFHAQVRFWQAVTALLAGWNAVDCELR